MQMFEFAGDIAALHRRPMPDHRRAAPSHRWKLGMIFALFSFVVTASCFVASLVLLNDRRYLGLRHAQKGAGDVAALATVEGAVFALIGLLGNPRQSITSPLPPKEAGMTWTCGIGGLVPQEQTFRSAKANAIIWFHCAALGGSFLVPLVPGPSSERPVRLRLTTKP